MTREEYEQSKAHIQEEHRVAVELLENARKAQLRALDLLWMIQGEGAGGEALAGLAGPAAPPAKQEAAKKPPRKSGPQVAKEIVAVVGRLPERFTRHDVIKALGYEPERGALFRALKDVTAQGYIRLEEAGAGHTPAIYRRNPKKSPAPA